MNIRIKIDHVSNVLGEKTSVLFKKKFKIILIRIKPTIKLKTVTYFIN